MMSEKFEEQVLSTFAVINNTLDEMRVKFDAIDQRFDTMDKRFDTMDKRFDMMDQRFDTMDKRFDKMDRRFDGLEQKVDENHDEVMTLCRQIDMDVLKLRSGTVNWI